MRTHRLKCHPGPFAQVRAGLKRHEVRVNDRAFVAGDVVVLVEWDPTPISPGMPAGETGAEPLRFMIGYVSEGGTWGLPPNLCVFTLLPVSP